MARNRLLIEASAGCRRTRDATTTDRSFSSFLFKGQFLSSIVWFLVLDSMGIIATHKTHTHRFRMDWLRTTARGGGGGGGGANGEEEEEEEQAEQGPSTTAMSKPPSSSSLLAAPPFFGRPASSTRRAATTVEPAPTAPASSASSKLGLLSDLGVRALRVVA
jgi:hypothetical protein